MFLQIGRSGSFPTVTIDLSSGEFHYALNMARDLALLMGEGVRFSLVYDDLGSTPIIWHYLPETLRRMRLENEARGA